MVMLNQAAMTPDPHAEKGMGPGGQSRATAVPVTSRSGPSPCDLESIEFARASPITHPAATVTGP
jgi:hypothetical protein